MWVTMLVPDLNHSVIFNALEIKSKILYRPIELLLIPCRPLLLHLSTTPLSQHSRYTDLLFFKHTVLFTFSLLFSCPTSIQSSGLGLNVTSSERKPSTSSLGMFPTQLCFSFINDCLMTYCWRSWRCNHDILSFHSVAINLWPHG